LAALFNSPSGIAIDLNGDLIVADFGNDRIRRISLTSGMVTTVAGKDTSGWQDGPVSQATFKEPHEVAVGSSGAIYVAEYNGCLIRKIEAGTVTTVAGLKIQNNCAYVDGKTTVAQLQLPAGLDVDGQGRIYVADSASSTVRLIEPAKALVSTAAGIGWGYQDGPAAAAKFRTPADVALGPGGKLYIAEHDGHRVRLLEGGMVSTVAGTGTPGHVDGDPKSARFDSPHSVAVDQSGAIYVTDFYSNTVRKIYP
jgi:DNA-binding beta-propeller fold protein YncE